MVKSFKSGAASGDRTHVTTTTGCLYFLLALSITSSICYSHLNSPQVSRLFCKIPMYFFCPSSANSRMVAQARPFAVRRPYPHEICTRIHSICFDRRKRTTRLSGFCRTASCPAGENQRTWRSSAPSHLRQLISPEWRAHAR